MAGDYFYRVGARDLDGTGRARICSMFALVLEAAGDDADALGFGVDDLGERGASWVLSRVALELSRLPLHKESVDICTWVSDYGRLLSTRNMTIAGIGDCVTQWAMIDIATRRPLDLRALSGGSASLVDRTPPIEMPHRIACLSVDAVRKHVVKYSDVDFNHHANSVKYLEWMLDTLPVERLIDAEKVRVDINYLHEARLGEQLEIHTDGTFFEIKNAEGISVCRASVKF